MEYNLIKFVGVHKRLEDRITVTKSSSIGLPSKFYDDNDIKNYKFAILFWDKENNVIGIHFSNEESEKDKFKIVHNKKYGGQILAKSFFKSLNIDSEKFRGRYDYELKSYDGIGKVYIINLKEANK
jgi:hypothetical protein